MRLMMITASALALFSCTTVPASMAGFDEVASRSEVVAVTGVGWSRAGDFTIEPLGIAGRFTRSSDETGADGVYLAEGHVRFQLSGEGEFAGLSGECALSRETLRQTDAVSERVEVETSVVTGPLVYSCGFFKGGRDVGALALRERSGEGLDLRALRDGTAEVGGDRLALRSIHELTASRWPSESALGFAMWFDDGEEAMLYSNGPSRHIALPRTGGDRRAAVLLTSLALTLMWDPGA